MGTRARGRPPHPDVLTPAEWRIVHAVRHGMSNREIARRRGISLDAVKFHVVNALDKLGLENRAALRLWRGAPVESGLNRKGKEVTTMEAELGPIGQISRQVADVERAVAWYRDVLRLTHLYTFPSSEGSLAFFDCAGTRLFLSRHRDGHPAEQSVLYFKVPNINAAYDGLKARGVEFTDAPHMIFRHPNGTEEWMAFFKDCDGQVLSIMSQVAPEAGASLLSGTHPQHREVVPVCLGNLSAFDPDQRLVVQPKGRACEVVGAGEDEASDPVPPSESARGERYALTLLGSALTPPEPCQSMARWT